MFSNVSRICWQSQRTSFLFFANIFLNSQVFLKIQCVYNKLSLQKNIKCKKKVPHLAGFIFLTIFPQLVISVLFVTLPITTIWIEDTINIFQIIFIFFELIFGYIATKNVITVQTMRFKIQRENKKEREKQLRLQQQQQSQLPNRSQSNLSSRIRQISNSNRSEQNDSMTALLNKNDRK